MMGVTKDRIEHKFPENDDEILQLVLVIGKAMEEQIKTGKTKGTVKVVLEGGE